MNKEKPNKLSRDEKVAVAYQFIEDVSLCDDLECFQLNYLARAMTLLQEAYPCMDATIGQMKLNGTWERETERR